MIFNENRSLIVTCCCVIRKFFANLGQSSKLISLDCQHAPMTLEGRREHAHTSARNFVGYFHCHVVAEMLDNLPMWVCLAHFRDYDTSRKGTLHTETH